MPCAERIALDPQVRLLFYWIHYKNTLIVKRLYPFFGVVFFLAFISACQDSTLVGENLINEDNTQVQSIDTMKVRSSSVLLDSLFTVNGSRMLCGAYEDPALGMVSSNCFFNLDTFNTFVINDEDNLIYDSLVLIMTQDYEYPAFDHLQKLQMLTLAESLDDEIFYFNSTQGPQTLDKVASFTYSTRLARTRDVRARMDDGLGRRLFAQAKNRDEFKLEDIVKGFCIKQEGSANGQAIIGFQTDKTFIKLYYHDRKSGEEGSVDLRLKPDLRFNQIQSDRSKSKLKDLVKKGIPLPSSSSNKETYVQSGVGISTMLDFPTLRSIRQNRLISVNLAYLDIDLPKSNYQFSEYTPLERIQVYVPTHKNTLALPYWFNNDNNPVTVIRTTNILTGNSMFRIYLTQYLSDIMNQDDDEYKGIMLYSPASSAGNNELTRLVLPTQQSERESLKLKVIFTVIK
jgi:hypothetical protein